MLLSTNYHFLLLITLLSFSLALQNILTFYNISLNWNPDYFYCASKCHWHYKVPFFYFNYPNEAKISFISFSPDESQLLLFKHLYLYYTIPIYISNATLLRCNKTSFHGMSCQDISMHIKAKLWTRFWQFPPHFEALLSTAVANSPCIGGVPYLQLGRGTSVHVILTCFFPGM